MLIVSWNINSIRAHFEALHTLINKYHPDIICLQEIKCIQDKFPFILLHEFGYNICINGQKSYNGVAVLSKHQIHKVDYDPAQDICATYPLHARYLEVVTKGIKVINIYAPNGNPITDTIKFQYKVDWTSALYRYLIQLQNNQELFLVVGDYNIAPSDDDCYDPKAFKNDAVTQPEVRMIWQQMLSQNLTDVLNTFSPKSQYTYWGYRGSAWQKNLGLRLDHVLMPTNLMYRVVNMWVDKETRGLLSTSDHAPIVLELED